jgi:hypothetical protein
LDTILESKCMFASPCANGTRYKRFSLYFASPWANGTQTKRVSV